MGLTLRGILAKIAETAAADAAAIVLSKGGTDVPVSVPEIPTAPATTKDLVKVALIQIVTDIIKAKVSGQRGQLSRMILQEPDFWVNKIHDVTQITNQLDGNSDDQIIIQAVKDALELFFQD